MRPHTLSGVLYAEDFDAPEPVVAPREMVEAVPEPIVIEPTFSLPDLHRASDRARQVERLLAGPQAEEAAALLRAQALARLADALDQARSDAARVVTETVEAVAQTILEMVAALLPAWSARKGHAEAEALLRLLLPTLKNEPTLAIRAHPRLVASFREDMAALAEDGGPAIEWIGSDAQAPGDLSIRWKDGTMIRDTSALCARISALIMTERAETCDAEETTNAHRD